MQRYIQQQDLIAACVWFLSSCAITEDTSRGVDNTRECNSNPLIDHCNSPLSTYTCKCLETEELRKTHRNIKTERKLQLMHKTPTSHDCCFRIFSEILILFCGITARERKRSLWCHANQTKSWSDTVSCSCSCTASIRQWCSAHAAKNKPVYDCGITIHLCTFPV